MNKKALVIFGIMIFYGLLFAQTQISEWDNYQVSTTMFPANPYKSIAVDRNGNKWIGTQNSGLLKFDGTNWEIYNATNSPLPTNRINHITFDSKHSLWIATNEGLVRKPENGNEAWTTYTTAHELFPMLNNVINYVIEDNANQIWVGTKGGMVRMNLDAINFSHYNMSQFPVFPSNDITAIQFQPGAGGNGTTIWVGTAQGLLSSPRDGNGAYNTWQRFTTSNSQLPGNGITNIRVDTRGNKWVSVYNYDTNLGAGLVQISNDNNTWSLYNTNTPNFPSNNIRGIDFELVGNEPLVWITTDMGIARFGGVNWTLFDTVSTATLPTNQVHGIIIERSNNNIKWFGTSNNMVRLDGSNWASFNLLHAGIPHDNIQAIAFDPVNPNIRWIGTANGLSRFNGEAFVVFNMANSQLPSNDIRSLAIDKTNLLWVGTAQFINIAGGLARYNPNNRTWEVYTSANSPLSMNTITSIKVCSQNIKWIGTQGGGLFALSPTNQWTSYSYSDITLASDTINDICIDDQDNKWIATDQGVSILWNNGTFSRINSLNSNLPSNFIKRIAQDKNKAIWAVTANGLVKLAGSNWIIYNSGNTGNVLREQNITGIDFDRDNVIWVTTTDGLVRTNEFDWKLYTTVSDAALLSHNQNFVKVENIVAGGVASSVKWIATADRGVVLFRGGGQLYPNNAYITVLQHPIITNSLKISVIVNNFIVNSARLQVNSANVSLREIAKNTWFADHLVPSNQNVGIRFTFSHANGDSTVTKNVSVAMIRRRSDRLDLGNNAQIEIIRDIKDERMVIAELHADENNRQYYKIPNLHNSLVDNMIIKTEKGNHIQRRASSEYERNRDWEYLPTQLDGKYAYAFINEPGDYRILQGDAISIKPIANLKNYPNPFNPDTNISFTLNHDEQNVQLDIFDIKGRKVRTLFRGSLRKGDYQFMWDGKNENNNAVATGVYLINVTSGSETINKKMLLLK